MTWYFIRDEAFFSKLDDELLMMLAAKTDYERGLFGILGLCPRSSVASNGGLPFCHGSK